MGIPFYPFGNRLVTATGDHCTDDTADAIKVLQVNSVGTTTDPSQLEDSAHVSGDAGVQSLGVRKDKQESIAGTDGDYTPPQYDRLGGLRTSKGTFGQPVLRADKNSVAYWSKDTTSPRNQKGGTGWLACLYGGVQTGDDWAAMYVPVLDELKVTDFDTAQWSYYMTGTETMGANIVIWVHDPVDFDKRAEITQLGGVAGLEKDAGWNAHEFDSTDAGMFWYGENTGTHDTTVTAGTQYTWAQFQADDVFSTWTIYRISIEHGWEASGTFDPVWVADLKLNGQVIQLAPAVSDLNAPVFQYQTGTGAIAAALAPKTPFQLDSIMVHFASAQTQDTLTITVDAGRTATVYDTLLYSRATATGSVTDLVIPFGEAYRFKQDDEIDVTYTGTDNDVYGLTYCWKVLP